jgi:hypothetical protein
MPDVRSDLGKLEYGLGSNIPASSRTNQEAELIPKRPGDDLV